MSVSSDNVILKL